MEKVFWVLCVFKCWIAQLMVPLLYCCFLASPSLTCGSPWVYVLSSAFCIWLCWSAWCSSAHFSCLSRPLCSSSDLQSINHPSNLVSSANMLVVCSAPLSCLLKIFDDVSPSISLVLGQMAIWSAPAVYEIGMSGESVPLWETAGGLCTQ